jgi:undecaprenyl diphosphate synthase
MDGNRRWAKAHGLDLLKGHQQVAETIIGTLVRHAIKRGVQYLTLWAFSTENWQRSQMEVAGLMQLFRKAFGEENGELQELGVRLNIIGNLSQFPEDIQTGVRAQLEATAHNSAITVTIALGYGGRDEIVRSVQKIVSQGAKSTDITTNLITQNLDTAGLPEPDLLIRTGGEQRLSGFLPWQSVYAELYFTPTLMPDFDVVAFDAALADYSKRKRRFGT